VSKSAEIHGEDLPYCHPLVKEMPPSRAARLVAETFSKQERGQRRIVDAGCGEGQDTLFLLGEGFRVIAIDASERNLDILRQKVSEAQIPDGMFTYHVADRPLRSVKILSEFKRVLKPKGELVTGEQVPMPKATVPKERVWARRWQIVKAMNHLLEQRHLEEIVPEDLEFCLDTLGFDSIRWAVFEGKDFGDSVEWGLRRPLATVEKLDDELLRKVFTKQIHELRNIFAQHGGAFLPYYILHVRKKLWQ